MKKYTSSVLGLFLLFALQAFAQEHYTEGPIWQVTLIRVVPTKMDTYLTTLQTSTKLLYDEVKKQNLIMDYKVYLNTTKHDLQDWVAEVGSRTRIFSRGGAWIGHRLRDRRSFGGLS